MDKYVKEFIDLMNEMNDAVLELSKINLKIATNWVKMSNLIEKLAKQKGVDDARNN